MTTNINTILSWFKTRSKPTQEEFRATWLSFWHKDEQIPTEKIEGLQGLLDHKADLEALENHKADSNAHSELFIRAKFIKTGELSIFKHPNNTDQTKEYILEINDLVQGFVEKTWINGYYIGGDISLLESFSVNTNA
ncbi:MULTISPECIES: hypothetical protein [Flavobacterium]|uniref:DUF695 domain-containing protein n=1 Tax=Flavobacterium lipolyticum TaxID=2893754 RepID=A0ABS8LV95_9FLAO|nr:MULTISPECIES: hypothetical protein [unclassified Flavobacterium]MCC9016492.1 hypothetical protein [Flavobacterium sp. F-126]